MEQIGAGGYGRVHRGLWQGAEVAVKTLDETVITERMKLDLANEGYIMSILHHPNIARFYGKSGRSGRVTDGCGLTDGVACWANVLAVRAAGSCRWEGAPEGGLWLLS